MSVANTNQYSIFGIQYAFWSALSSGAPYGVTGTIANGGNAGMGRLRGVQDFNITEPVAETVYVPGDNGVSTSFKVQPTELPTGTLTTGVLDQTFASKSNGTVIYADGQWDEVSGVPACYSFADICLVLNSPATAQESGNLDESGWVVTEVYKIQNQASILAQMQSGAAVSFPNNMTLKRATSSLAGRSFSVANDGTTALAFKQYMSPYPVTYHAFVGDNSVTTVTLNETPVAASGDAVQLWQTNVKKTYTTDFSVVTSTRVLTFVSAPGTGVKNIIKYQFVPSC